MSVPKLVLQSEIANLEHEASSGNQVADAIAKILKGLPYGASMTVGALTSGHRDITIQLLNGEGKSLSQESILNVWVSDAAGGAQTASATLTTTVVTGTLVNADVANKLLRVLTSATGQAVVRIADTGKTYYLNSDVDGLVSSAAVVL